MARIFQEVIFGGNSSKYEAAVKRVNASSKSVSGTLARMAKAAVSAFVAFGAFRGLSSSIEAFKKQEQAVAKLENTMVSMGRAIPTQQLRDFATQLQREGIFGDEAIIEGQVMLATFREISDEAMPRATRVAADLAAQFGMSMESASKIVGKAAMGMTGELSRYGISLSEAAKKSKDFNLIMLDIEAQVDGANRALGATATGGLTQLSNAWGDLMEVMGESTANFLEPAVEAFTSLLYRINDVLERSEFEKNAEHLAALEKELEAVLKLSQEDYKNDRFFTWKEDVQRLRREIAGLKGDLQSEEFMGVEKNAAAQAAFDKAKRIAAAKDAEEAAKSAAKVQKAKNKIADDLRKKALAGAFSSSPGHLGDESERAGIGAGRKPVRDVTFTGGSPHGPHAPGGETLAERNAQAAEIARQHEKDALISHNQAIEDIQFEFQEVTAYNAEDYRARMKRQLDAAREDDIISERDYQKRIVELNKKADGAIAKQKEAFWGAMINLRSSGNKTLAGIGRAAAIADIVRSTLRDAPLAFAKTSAAFPFPLGPALGAAHAAAIVAANASAIGKFNKGGIVPGGAPYMDRVPAVVSPGEAVLPRNLTDLLMRAADRGGEDDEDERPPVRIELELVGDAGRLIRARQRNDEALGTLLRG